MKPTVLGIVIVLALIAAGAIFYAGSAFAPAPAPEQLYSNETYGISFSYPVGYILSEQGYGVDMRDRYTITLIREEDAVPVVAGGEGPVSITVEVYPSPASGSVSDWLSLPESNFALGNGAREETTAGGADAVRYGWSGLYEGITTALVHNGRVIAVSGTYMSPADQIRADYEMIVSSLRLR